jgi:hypothetical protein
MPDSDLGMTDKLVMSVVRSHPLVSPDIKSRLSTWQAQSRLAAAVIATLPHLPNDLAHELLDRIMASAVIESALRLVTNHSDGHVTDHGVVDRRVVTTAGAIYLCASGHSLYDFNFHGLGTGATAPAVGDTTLGTEYTSGSFSTSYRATGAQSNTASGANEIYKSVATNTANTSVAPVELGLFSAASAGTLWDRFTFSVVNLAAADSLSSTVSTTVNSGG